MSRSHQELLAPDLPPSKPRAREPAAVAASNAPCSKRGPSPSTASRGPGSGFTLAPGGILGLLGPNGSGKSTTVSILTGLLEPSGGTVLLDGRPVRDDLLAYKSRIGYVPEEAVLYTYLTGPEYSRSSAGSAAFRRSAFRTRSTDS